MLIKGEDTYLTVEEAARSLKMTPGYIRTLLVRGQIPAMQGIRRRLYILEQDLKKYRELHPGPGEIRPYVPKKKEKSCS